MPRRKPTASLKFEDLPDDAFVREPELLRQFPIGRSTLWRQIVDRGITHAWTVDPLPPR